MTAPDAPQPRILRKVRVKTTGGDEVMEVAAFLALEPVKRNWFIVEKKVDFLDGEGKVMPLVEALKQLMRMQ